MTLQDLENVCLATLQVSNPPPNFGGAPAWSSASNPQYSQSLIDFEINEAYRMLLADTADMYLTTITVQFFSTANTFSYPINQSGTPECQKLWRVFYQPVGLPYATEFRPGTQFVSWEAFQNVTGQGYLTPYSYGTQPTYCAVYPNRKNIGFYPGSANVGDKITLEYTPLPTAGAGLCPTLVSETDTPITPSDTHRAIAYRALAELWIKGREAGMSQQYMQMYEKKIADIRKRYEMLSGGDTRTVDSFGMSLSAASGRGVG